MGGAEVGASLAPILRLPRLVGARPYGQECVVNIFSSPCRSFGMCLYFMCCGKAPYWHYTSLRPAQVRALGWWGRRTTT